MKQTLASQHLKTVEENMDYARELGLALQSTEDETISGREITLNGRKLINFGSGTYMGWEQDNRLKDGAVKALQHYGTQFGSSRAYLSLGLYEELEDLLTQMFKAPVIAAASSTLGHLSALPILIGENDAVILDHQVHASVSMASQLLKANGVRIEMIRHDSLEMLENRIQKLSHSHDRIWYLADGIYSMHGAFAPFEGMMVLLQRYEQLRLYIDDAHSISWTGENGAGKAAPFFAGHPQVFVTGSLCKSFSAAGGVLVFPDEASRELVRKCGGTMIFSGPIQPPMLGAAVASARIHLSDELPARQADLLRKIRLFNRAAAEKGLNLASYDETPIRFVSVGNTELGYQMAKSLLNQGYYVNIAAYPSVPRNKSGLRISINHHLEPRDILNLVNLIAEQMPESLKLENRVSTEVLAEL